MEEKYNIKFLVNNRVSIFSNAIIISETDIEIKFIDSYTNKPITYSKKFFVSKELV